jgi:hypothetical protein
MDGGDDLAGLIEIIGEHTKDINILNTAVNRIERKQNRWLEILNLKSENDKADSTPSPEGLSVSGPAHAPEQALTCGQPCGYESQFL